MGLIHIYCGDGKGKTTASVGLAVRAAGAGLKVHFVQLLKGNESSELNILRLIPEITISRCEKNYGFTFSMTSEDKQNITESHNLILKEAIKLAESNMLNMLIIDEFNTAYQHGLLDRELAKNLVLNKPEKLELILTGRNPDKIFIKAADYVSEISAVKHPYKNGITARRGIEY
ncbi:MAG: cob(I)yrinic acid a,c-diamide adenosyltransferase [Oscillospiraceae bacterium]|jgi:cob(I)alamin adenosyltransferase